MQSKEIKFSDLSDKEIKAYLALYRKAGTKVPTLNSREEVNAWLEAQRVEGGIGTPHIVNEADLETNPELKDSAKVGDVILLAPVVAAETVQVTITEEDLKAHPNLAFAVGDVVDAGEDRAELVTTLLSEQKERADTKAEADKKAKEGEGNKPKTATPNKGKNTTPTPEAKSTVVQMLEGKIVLEVRPTILNGVSYLDVSLNDGTVQRLSREEFEQRVTDK